MNNDDHLLRRATDDPKQLTTTRYLVDQVAKALDRLAENVIDRVTVIVVNRDMKTEDRIKELETQIKDLQKELDAIKSNTTKR